MHPGGIGSPFRCRDIFSNIGFSDDEVGDIYGYIDDNLPLLVDMALERTEAGT